MRDELTQNQTENNADTNGLGTRHHFLTQHSALIHHHSERGAALVALLALLSIMALVLIGAAPSVYQQVLRQRELESMRRGDEIAEAIRIYASVTGKLPTKMDDLLDGVQLPGRTKKLMILRRSAATDPLSSSGEWRHVAPNDKVMGNFVRELKVFHNGVTPNSPPVFQTNPRFQTVFAQLTSVVNIETSEEKDPPGDEDETENTESEFIGVTSRARTKAVMTFYGIERHDWWVYTPLFRGEVNNNGGNVIPRNGGNGLGETGKPSN